MQHVYYFYCWIKNVDKGLFNKSSVFCDDHIIICQLLIHFIPNSLYFYSRLGVKSKTKKCAYCIICFLSWLDYFHTRAIWQKILIWFGNKTQDMQLQKLLLVIVCRFQLVVNPFNRSNANQNSFLCCFLYTSRIRFNDNKYFNNSVLNIWHIPGKAF